MTRLWQADDWLTIRAIRGQIRYRPVAHTTVAAVTSTLHTKGYLRKRHGPPAGRGRRSWQYRAAAPLTGYLGDLIAELLRHSPHPGATLSHALGGHAASRPGPAGGAGSRPGSRAATQPRASSEHDSGHCGAVAVGTALLRLTLPYLMTGPGLCLSASRAGDTLMLHATYPTSARPAPTSARPAPTDASGQQLAADLAIVDAIATCWGQCGDDCTQTLWAVLGPARDPVFGACRACPVTLAAGP